MQHNTDLTGNCSRSGRTHTYARVQNGARQRVSFRRKPCGPRKSACASQKADKNFAFGPRKRSDWQLGPSFELDREQAVQMQLQVHKQLCVSCQQLLTVPCIAPAA